MNPRRLAVVLAAACAAAACGDGDLGTALPGLVVNPRALDFEQLPVLDDRTIVIQLRNAGRASLQVDGIEITGDPDGVFTLGEIPSEVAAGRTFDLEVRFQPKAQQAYAGKVVIESKDPKEPLVEVTLKGTGSTAATATITPRELDFGRVGEGRSAVRRVQVTSTGTADLKIRTIAFKGGSSAAYGFVGSTRTPQVLRKHVEGETDELVEITVKFAPTAAVTDTAGTLVLETTDPDNALVEIPLTASINRAPISVPKIVLDGGALGTEKLVAPGTEVDLDGSGSSDPDGDVPLTFKWTLVERPHTSGATIAGDDTANPSFTPDQPGGYVAELVVTDAAGLSSRTERVRVIGATSDKLIVQLTWSHPTADLDLHVRPLGQAFGGDADCTWWNPNPDWGQLGDPNDDPAHLGDRLSGFGPEYVIYEEPADGQYTIAVKYISPQGSSDLKVRATVRVFLYGAIQREMQHEFTSPSTVWTPAAVTWPSGVVSDFPAGVTP